MKKVVLLTTAIVVTLMAGTALGKEVDLIAGQNTVVGTVKVTHALVDGTYVVSVEYDVTVEFWKLTETHVHVAKELSDIPQTNKGKPIPGNFEYGMVHDPPVRNYIYEIPVPSWEPDNDLYIVTHAVVEHPCGLFLPAVPEEEPVDIIVYYPGTGVDIESYFDINVLGGTPLDGWYDGWCIKRYSVIQPGILYTAFVYPSYHPSLSSLIGQAGDLDQVNWLLNQNYVGQDVQDVIPDAESTGIITYGDIQLAIWTLIDLPAPHWSLGDYSQDRVDEIVEYAEANGEGFVPDCGDIVLIVLVPWEWDDVKEIWVLKQPVIIGFRTSCCESETAWGAGIPFLNGKGNWSTYFIYTGIE
ncbi:MAG: hypothetical protein ACYS80_15595 [Planctomycetota bacterium]|jgi:hypothetical protein